MSLKNGAKRTPEPAWGRRAFTVVLLSCLLLGAAARAAAQTFNVMFPRGPSVTVPFTGNDIGDYELIFLHDGDDVTGDQIHLSVTPVLGTGFKVEPVSDVSASDYLATFPTASTLNIKITVPAGIVEKANNANTHTAVNFQISFDASPLFGGAEPSEDHSQLWTKTVDVYEGDASPSALEFSQTVVADGAKRWGLGARSIRCEIAGVSQGAMGSPTDDDSGLFELGTAATTTSSGTVSVRFKEAPDFEDPPAGGTSNNNAREYNVRVHNGHNLHNLDAEGSPTGCNGSALDVVVRLNNVGAPARVQGVSATRTGNTTTLTWDAPQTDDAGVSFADLSAGVQITGYDYRYRTPGAASWTDGTRTTATSADVPVSEPVYEFQARAVSPEGEGGWSATVSDGEVPNVAPPQVPNVAPPVVRNAAPSFRQARYRFELPENRDGSRHGLRIGRVTALDPDGDSVTYILAEADRSRFAVGRDGALTYTGPGEDFETEPNQYVLTVRARDGHGGGASASVLVVVTQVNESPRAVDDTARTREDVRVVIDVTANDVDPDGDDLRLETLWQPAHGTVRAVEGGVAYEPEEDYHGVDRFTYRISDGDGLTATASVEVTVVPVNDAPTPVGVMADQALDEGGDAVTVDVAAFFEDVDGDELTYRADSSDPVAVAVTVAGSRVTVTPVASGEATVTVTAEDPEGLAATQTFVVGVSGRLVRTVLEDTLAAMARGQLASARMTLGRRAAAGGNQRSRMNVMGRELPLGSAWTAAGQMLAGWLPKAGVDEYSPSGAAVIGPAALGGSAADRIGPGAWSGPGGFDDVARGWSFLLALGDRDSDEARPGRELTLWGQGDVQTFDGGRSAGSGYDGDLRTVYLGADTRITDVWLAGVAVGYTRGAGDWRVGTARGRLGTKLYTVQPYVRWTDGTTSLWTMAGVGEGTAENVRPSSGSVETEALRLALGLLEVRRRMGTIAGGVRVGMRGDAALARLATGAGKQTVDGLRATVRQMRFGVELSRPYRIRNGLALTPFGELHARRDGGAGATGTGVEMAGGLRASRDLFQFDARGRLLTLHSASRYREWGASVNFRFGEDAGRPGFSLSLTPRWGAPATGTGMLWRDHLRRPRAPRAAGGERGLDARVGYSFPLGGDRLLTPFGTYGRSESGRRLRLGARLTGSGDRILGALGAGMDGPLQVELSVERHRRPGGEVDRRVGVSGILRFGGK